MAKFIISAFADEASSELDKQIEALKRNGLSYLEPRNISGDLTKKSDEELEKIAKKLNEAGIKVSSLGSPIGKFDIDGDFEEHLKSFHRALRACQIFETENMRMFSFFVPQDRLAECRGEVFRRLNILLDEADKAGITLCHENESQIYGQNPEQVEELLTNLPRLRGIFDAGNYIMNGCDAAKGIDVTLPSLKYLHIKDAISASRRIVPAGMGDGRYDEVIKAVDAHTDDTVFLTVEPHLHVFDAYSKIDSHELKVGMSFRTSDEAFDFAVTSLKKLLTSLGYSEGEDKIWKK